MSSQPSHRAVRSAALLDTMGQVSALSVLFSQAVADRVGINSTDLEALDILRRHGPLSAGQLAESTGLSTGGAITALIDRLERRGYVRREPDPADRRRVIVRALSAQAERELGPLYAELIKALDALLVRYSDEEIDVILDFSSRSGQILSEQIARVRSLGLERAPAAPDETPR